MSGYWYVFQSSDRILDYNRFCRELNILRFYCPEYAGLNILMMKKVILHLNKNYSSTVRFRRMAVKSLCHGLKSSAGTGAGFKPVSMPVNLTDETDDLKRLTELESELNSEKELRSQLGLFYIISLVIFFIISFIPDTSSYPPDFQFAWSWAGLFLLLPPVMILAKKTGMTMSDLGITIRNLRKNIIEGLLFSFCLCVIMLVIRYITIPDGASLINWKSLSSFSRFLFLVYISTYWIHCYIQEFITRGVLQGLSHRFFREFHFLFPIFLISLLFCAAHIRISLFFGAMTFIISMIFGYIYYRHKNLIGVSIVHYITGILAMALGYF